MSEARGSCIRQQDRKALSYLSQQATFVRVLRRIPREVSPDGVCVVGVV